MDCQLLDSTPDQLPRTWLCPLEESVEVRLLVSSSSEEEEEALRLCSLRPGREMGEPGSVSYVSG